MPLQTTDSRMLQLIDILKTSGTIRFTQDFCDTLGIKKQNIPSLKKGIWSFTAKQIATVCEVYGVNPSWIFGYSEQVFRSRAYSPPRQSSRHPAPSDSAR